MNNAWHVPLVESGPAGSRITEDAERLIAAYLRAEARHMEFLLKLGDRLPARPA